MGGDLRAGTGAGRLQRTLAMRFLRVASASVLAIVALLLWKGLAPSSPRAHDVGKASAVSSAVTRDADSAVAVEQRLANGMAAQPTRIGARHQLLVRSRATEGDGDPAPTSALASSPATLFGNVAESTRAHLRWLALGHAPYGEPSPFDATAPPAPSPRNG